MAGASGGRSLEQTPTWAVAVVCFVLVAYCHRAHHPFNWKVGQSPISNICISKSVGATWHPCSKKQEGKKYPAAGDLGEDNRRKLLMAEEDVGGSFRRILAAGETDKCAAKA
ncbi:UNVERIFIED_CONTAM: MLO-like protein 2 [Sesamum radiatum]|uniref:MLO-like protein 2 n=1 Tax=Sesamum radiatum TaxID=300843 RepID=A0AAW2UPA0_SESRA